MIRAATADDLPQINKIYEYARSFMADNANPTQWSGGYPKESMLKNDIENQNLYVIENDNGICAVFAFIIGEDKSYEVIENGSWLSDSAYGTIHRIASDGKAHGILKQAVEFCLEKIPHLRIDTHADNLIMQRQILKNGFKRCGTIYVDDGTARIAYELIL